MQTNNKKSLPQHFVLKTKILLSEVPRSPDCPSQELLRRSGSILHQPRDFDTYFSGLGLDISWKKNVILWVAIVKNHLLWSELTYIPYLLMIPHLCLGPLFICYCFSNVPWIDGDGVEIRRDTHFISAFVTWNYAHHGQYEIINIPFG